MKITREQLAALGSLSVAMGFLSKAKRELEQAGVETGIADIEDFLRDCHTEVFCRFADELGR